MGKEKISEGKKEGRERGKESNFKKTSEVKKKGKDVKWSEFKRKENTKEK